MLPNEPANSPDPGILPPTDPLGGFETPPQHPTQPKNTTLRWVLVGAGVLIVLMVIVSLIAVRGAKKDQDAAPATSDTQATVSADDTELAAGEFTFTPPEGWQKDTTPQAGAIVSYSQPGSESEALPTSISLTKIETDKTLDEYQSEGSSELTSQFSDFSELSKENVTLGSTPAILVSGSFNAGDKVIDCMFLTTKKGRTSYTLTALATDEAWVQNSDAIRTSLLSFRP